MQRICFRADASYDVGYGHFIRTLALADMLKEDFDCIFYTSEPTEYQVREMQKVCPYVVLKEESKFEDFLSTLNGDEIVVLDNYFFTTEYQRLIKNKGCKLVCIDDIHDKHYVADAIINHTPGIPASQFIKEEYTRLFLGSDYLLLRRQFREAAKDYSSFENNKSIYICFGGSDEFNFTRRACKIIFENRPNHIDVVVGGAYEFYEDLIDYAYGKDIAVYRNASPELIVRLLRGAYLAVVPDSMVFFEACCLRRPIISGYNCDNQMLVSQFNQHNQLGYDLGNMKDNFEKKFLDAYMNVEVFKMFEYTKKQSTLINDSSVRLIRVFKSL